MRSISQQTEILGTTITLFTLPLSKKYAAHHFVAVENPKKLKDNIVYYYTESTKAENKYNQQIEEFRQKEKTAQAKKDLKASDFYKVGDYVVNIWGYEQTNVQFYIVVAVTAKCIRVREVKKSKTYTESMSGTVVPVREFMDKEYLLRVKPEGRLSNPESHHYFTKWDGKPCYFSEYA